MIAGDVPIPLHYIAFPLHPHYSPSIFPFYSIPRLDNQMVFPFFLVHSGKKSLPSGWWFGTVFIFHILGIIIPTDELIFFRGVGIPPTSFTSSTYWCVLRREFSGIIIIQSQPPATHPATLRKTHQ